MNELHLNTITGINVISFNPSAGGGGVPLDYSVVLTQTGNNDPVIEQVVNNDMGITPTIVRVAQGKYTVTSVGSFLLADIIVQNGGNKTNGYVTNAYRETDDIVNIDTFDHSNHTVDFEDGVMDCFNLQILQYNQSGGGGGGGTPEQQFDSIIAEIDDNQLDTWIKIIVRDSNLVYETSGKKYRKSGNYATSTELINS